MQIIGCYDFEFGWLVERAGCEITAGYKAIKAVDDKGKIHGMVGYGNWTENSCIMSIALDTPSSLRSLLKWAFAYPFFQCGRNVVFATVREKNERSMRLCKRVGMRVAARLKDAIVPGEDMVIFEMRKEWCPYLYGARRKAA